jgi:DNA/RNA endonuclease YhcR with UshA esterase domain
MKSLFYIITILLLMFSASNVFAADTITPEDASKYVGKQATVCGKVASTHYSTRSRRQPTFININRPYPNQIFTALIWGADRIKFQNAPENYYRNKNICVSGLVEQYKGTPEIIVRNPNQISEQ